MLPGFMRDETEGLVNKAYFSNPITSLKLQLSDLKTANCNALIVKGSPEVKFGNDP